VHGAVKEMLKNKEINATKHFYFSYKMDASRGIAVPDTAAKLYAKLSNKEFRAKRDIIKKLYGFNRLSFENRSCSNLETFTI